MPAVSENEPCEACAEAFKGYTTNTNSPMSYSEWVREAHHRHENVLRAEIERLTTDNNEKALALARARVILRDLGPHLWAISVMGSTNEEEARALRLLGLRDSSARPGSQPKQEGP